MEEGIIVPLIFFGLVVMVVAIVHAGQLEHQRRMRELDLELERVKEKSQSTES